MILIQIYHNSWDWIAKYDKKSNKIAYILTDCFEN